MTYTPPAFIHAHNFEPRSPMGFSIMVCTICGASQASVQQDIGGWAQPSQ